MNDEKLPPVVSLANVTQFCTYSESSCGAPNDRALMIYRRACYEGIISNGDKLIVTGDLDAVLNMDVEEWGELVTAADEKLPPVDVLLTVIDAIESAKAKRAAVDAKLQNKPRKPYRIWQPNYKWPPSPRVIRVPLLGEVS